MRDAFPRSPDAARRIRPGSTHPEVWAAAGRSAFETVPRGRLGSAAVLHVTILVILCALSWAPRLRGPLDLRWDGGVYYLLGTSLVEGRGYRLPNEPGEIQAIQYPPLLPLLAAAEQAVTGTRDPRVAGHALRWTYALVFTAYVLAAYALARRFLSAGWSLLAGLVTLLHIHTSWLSDLFYAEIPYGLVTLLFFLAAGRPPVGRAGAGSSHSSGEARPAPGADRTRRAREIAAGALAAAAYLLRTIGLTLLAAWVGESLFRGRFRQAAVRLAVALVPVAGWQLYIVHVKASPDYRHPAYAYQRAAYQYYNVGYLENLMYVDPFVPERGKLSAGALAARAVSGLAGAPAAIGEAVSSRVEWTSDWLDKLGRRAPSLPPVPAWLPYLPLILLGALAIGGLILLAKGGEVAIPIYVAGTLALVSVVPWPDQVERYLAPLTPLFALALFRAVASARERFRRAAPTRRSRSGLALTTLVPICVLLQESLVAGLVYGRQHREVTYPAQDGRQRTYRLFFYTESWRLHDAALDWLAARAHAREVTATSTPQWFYLKSGRKAVLPPFEPNPAVAERLLESVPVDYLVLDGLEFRDTSRRYLAPVVHAFPDRWEPVYSTRNGVSRVYRRRAIAGEGRSRP